MEQRPLAFSVGHAHDNRIKTRFCVFWRSTRALASLGNARWRAGGTAVGLVDFFVYALGKLIGQTYAEAGGIFSASLRASSAIKPATGSSLMLTGVPATSA